MEVLGDLRIGDCLLKVGTRRSLSGASEEKKVTPETELECSLETFCWSSAETVDVAVATHVHAATAALAPPQCT